MPTAVPIPMETDSLPGGYLPDSFPPDPDPLTRRLPPAPLPKVRNPPLHAQSRAAAALKDHLDKTMLAASRDYHRRFQLDDGEELDVDSEEGQKKMKEGLRNVLSKLEQCVDLVWISGLPAVQVPYLLRLTDDVNDYLSGYAADLPPTLHLLSKLDQAFHSLLLASAPNMAGPRVLSQTDRVRLKSIAERVRLHVVGLAEQWDDGMEVEGDEDGEIEWEIEAANVFRLTLGVVGSRMADLGVEVEGDANEVPEVGMSLPEPGIGG